MKRPKIGRSPYLEAVFDDIWEDLESLGYEEVRHYARAFPREPDYNLVNYGCMRVYYFDIRDLYAASGVPGVTDTYRSARSGHDIGDYKLGDDRLWEAYRGHVGQCARAYLEAFEGRG